MKHYFYLAEGETIRSGDEVEMSMKYNDPPKWEPAKSIGATAPNPNYISHRVYRRELTIHNYINAESDQQKNRIVEALFGVIDSI